METYWGPHFDALARTDPEIAAAVLGELDRQRGNLQLIASENFTSPAVLAALGSTLTNKYAEGYPGRRYYAGCEQVDLVERRAVERAMGLFGAGHANVQPHSGSAANLAAYAAVLRPGDTILAMELPHGGHLTHGSRVNFSGRWFHTVGYPVDPHHELIDYEQVRELAHTYRPQLIVCGATAYPRDIDYRVFREIADEVDAYLLVDAAHTIGLIAGGVTESPVPYADLVTASTHKVLRGPRGGMILCRESLAKRVDQAVFPFLQGGPMMHVIAAKAVALQEAATTHYQRYTEQVVANARALADGLTTAGLRPVTGGTDTHLVLVDLRAAEVPGDQAEQRCQRARIVANKNAIPYDPRPPTVASGIRLGTPAVTSQGMRQEEMRQVAELVAAAVRTDPATSTGPARLAELASEVTSLVHKYPAYPHLP